LDEDGKHVDAGAKPCPAIGCHRYEVQVPDVEVSVLVEEAQIHGDVVVEGGGCVVEAETDDDGSVHSRPQVVGAEEDPE